MSSRRSILELRRHGQFLSKQAGRWLLEGTRGPHDPPTAYLYGPRNRLLEVRRAGLLLETYRYDHRGLRVRRAGPDGVVHAVYDDTSLLVETDPAGNTLRKYDYGPDRLLSLAESTGERRFYLFDALGSVTDLVSSAGAVEARYVYDAWGNLRRDLGTSENPFAFTGHRLDRPTGLYYAKARYYDPEIGLFLTEDPFQGQVQNPPSLHRYLYAYQNPTVWVDPTGRQNEQAPYRWTDEGDIPAGTEYFVWKTEEGIVYYSADLSAWPEAEHLMYGTVSVFSGPAQVKEEDGDEAWWKGAVELVTESTQELGASLKRWGEGFDRRQAEQMERGASQADKKESLEGVSGQAEDTREVAKDALAVAVDVTEVSGGGKLATTGIVLIKKGMKKRVSREAAEELMEKGWTVADEGAEAAGRRVAARSLDDIGSLRGASPREIDELIPEGWVASETRHGGGTRFANPERLGEQIRVMPGNPRDPNPLKRGPYLRISRHGHVSDPIPLEGNPGL